MATNLTYTAKNISAIKDHVLVKNMEFSERITSGGIILPSDDAKTSGIRPRWAEVVAIGPDQIDVKVGEWVLVKHGRWTRGIKMSINDEEIMIRRVDPNDILVVSKVPMTDDTFSNAVQAQEKHFSHEGSLHSI